MTKIAGKGELKVLVAGVGMFLLLSINTCKGIFSQFSSLSLNLVASKLTILFVFTGNTCECS